MKILSKYILSEWKWAFLVAILATAGLLLVEDFYKNLQNFVQNGASFGQILLYYFWLILKIIPTVLPVAFFLSLLFSLSKLHLGNELVAMRAMGKNIFQITLPLWISGVLLSVLSLFFNVYLSSFASQNTQNFYANMENHGEAITKYKLNFNNERDRRMWFIGSFEKKTRSGTNAMLYFYDDVGNEISRVFAKTFEYLDGVWVLHNGYETTFANSTNYSQNVLKFSRKEFHFNETPDLFFSLTKRMKYLSFFEMRKILSFSKGGTGNLGCRIQFYGSIASAMSYMVITIATISFVTVGVKKTPMVGVSKACAVMFVFYVVSSICDTLGANGTLPLIPAIGVPYLFIILGSYTLSKKRT